MSPVENLWFHTLDRRFTLQATLTARTGFRVGRGREYTAADTDLPLLKLHDQRVLIPGSTWKGILRNGAERLLRGIDPELACDPFNNPCITALDKDEQLALEKVDRSQRAAWLRNRNAGKICHACATFGAPGLASRVRTADCLLEAGTPTRIRDGVAMDRDLNRASDGMKFDYEVIEPGATFSLTLQLENADDWQVGLLLAMFEDLNEGHLRLGGFGTRGLGWLTVSGLTVTERTLEDILRRRSGMVLRDAQLARFDDALSTLWKS